MIHICTFSHIIEIYVSIPSPIRINTGVRKYRSSRRGVAVVAVVGQATSGVGAACGLKRLYAFRSEQLFVYI